MATLTWAQVLSWRLRRQGLDPLGATDTVGLVRRLAGVQAQVASAADLAVAVRQTKPRHNAVTAALVDRTLVKTWAMRGTLHALAPDQAGAFLSLLADTRSWEKPSWQRAFGATPAEVAALADAVAAALDGRVLSREELVAEVVARTGNAHLRQGLTSGWSMLLKPVAWQGLLCHGPPDGIRVTFTRPTWGALQTPDEAAPVAIRAYLGAYGPASPDLFDNWVTRRGFPKKKLRSWFDAMGAELTTVDVSGVPLVALAAHVDELHAAKPSRSVRLIPGFDQWILGPGTGATEIVPADHRADVSRTAGWISPVVLLGGRAVGVWELADSIVEVRLWERVPASRVEAEVSRLGLPVSEVRVSEG